jgi:hypothetical protein
MGPGLPTNFDCRQFMAIWHVRDTWLLPPNDEVDFFRPRTPPSDPHRPTANPTFPGLFSLRRVEQPPNSVRLDATFDVSSQRPRPETAPQDRSSAPGFGGPSGHAPGFAVPPGGFPPAFAGPVGGFPGYAGFPAGPGLTGPPGIFSGFAFPAGSPGFVGPGGFPGSPGSPTGAPGFASAPGSAPSSSTESRAGTPSFSGSPGVFPTPGSTTSRFPGTATGVSPRTFTPGPVRVATPATHAPNVPTGLEDNAEDHSELERGQKRRRDDAV